MRNEKVLTKLLRSLADLLGEEADRNPAFREQLDGILSGLSPASAKPAKTRGTRAAPDQQLPDIHAERSKRGEVDFRVWLGDQPVPVLRALIRNLDIDPKRRTSRWTEGKKLSEFIADSLRARMSKGSSFLKHRETTVVNEHRQDCPLCQRPAHFIFVDYENRKYFRCDRCTEFQISRMAENRLADAPQEWRDDYARKAREAHADSVLVIRVPSMNPSLTARDTQIAVEGEYVPRSDLPG
jgi:hypothetical protein